MRLRQEDLIKHCWPTFKPHTKIRNLGSGIFHSGQLYFCKDRKFSIFTAMQSIFHNGQLYFCRDRKISISEATQDYNRKCKPFSTVGSCSSAEIEKFLSLRQRRALRQVWISLIVMQKFENLKSKMIFYSKKLENLEATWVCDIEDVRQFVLLNKNVSKRMNSSNATI